MIAAAASTRRTRLRQALGALALAGGMSCKGDEGTGTQNGCTQTTSVTATVTVGASVTFTWDPPCAVALLLVEQDASDQWAISAPNLSETSTESANIILPPVTYGQVPAGAEQLDTPATLSSGTTYELVLWKIKTANSAQCQQSFENACLLTVKQFVR